MSECMYVVWYKFHIGNEKSLKLTKMKMKNNTFNKILSIRENNHNDITPKSTITFTRQSPENPNIL